MSSIFQIILIGFIEPYKEKAHNTGELINEVTTVLIMYHIFCFTDWIPDANVKYDLGYSCLTFNFINLSFNVSNLLIASIKQVRMAWRKGYIKHKFIKNRNHTTKRFSTRSFVQKRLNQPSESDVSSSEEIS